MMDTVLRNALIIDGTGSAGYAADVGIEGGRIAALGDLSRGDARGADTIDLEGLVLAPGFVDSHTHYDAQLLWDPDLTPSSWHGVTSVVIGNCGFGIAPTRPAHREKILRILENVEGMLFEALKEGVRWTFETFPEYLQAVDAAPKRCNVGALVGHTPIRLYVMGDESVEREATLEEVTAQRALVEEALAAGAIGFASAKTDVHVGEGGGPVPSRMAANSEIAELAQALSGLSHGIMQFTWGEEFGFEELLALSQRLAPRPVTFTALLQDAPIYMGTELGRTGKDVLEAIRASHCDTLRPQVSARPLTFQLTMEDPFALAQGRPAFQEVVAAPRSARHAFYRDPAWRERAKSELGPEWAARWYRTTIQETNAHGDLIGGPSIGELAAKSQRDPFDLIADLALDDDLATRFRIELFNFDETIVGELITDPQAIISLSDAGAHASQLCDANFCTYLLQHWVRELDVMSLPEAIRRLTSEPALLYGLTDRGTIAQGKWADLVAFDPATVGTTELERVWDLPGGADRLIAHSHGIEGVWVNGIATRLAGQAVAGAYPGRLIRGGE